MAAIVNCVAYRKGRKLGDVALGDISEILREPDTFVWLGLHEPGLPLLREAQREFGLHELAVEDALNAHQRPKLEAYGDSLFIVLNTAQLAGDEVLVGETHLFVGPQYVVSVRHGASNTYAPVRERCEQDPHGLANGPGYVLYAVMDFIVDHYIPIDARLQETFEEVEQAIFRDEFDRGTIARLYHLKRQVLRLRNGVNPIGEICGQLIRLHGHLVPRELRVYFRDVEDHANRLLSDLDMVREMLTAAVQVHLALVTVRQNEVVKQLAGWGAILAIPTVVFSLYGMNFAVMPELKWQFGYPALLAATTAACLLLWRRLHKAGWI